MTDVLDEPLRSAALYNPHLLSEQEVEDLFVVRLDLLEEILDGLRGDDDSGSRQHRLIIGQRGMGKTMLLRRIQVAVDSDSELSARFLPLTFPEEQWDVTSARDFWMNCLDSLSDAFERRGETALVEELDRQIDELPGGDRAAEKALELLTHLAEQSQVVLVLLVDNVDQILERVEEWSLRETLSSNSRLILVGASSVMLESTFNYDKAFYDFLKIHYLQCLSLAETERFLLDYATRFDAPRVAKTVREEGGRIGALHALSGGNPRTTVLFFRILNAGFSGDVKNDLEQLLDQCTPLYKARVEELPPQSRKVLHGLAMAWNPTSAGELAESIHIDTNVVSSQLARLVKLGLVEKASLTAKKTSFQIAERFFNIWFLMRGSRRIRRRVTWLVRFLEIFFRKNELREDAIRLLKEGMESVTPEYSVALADSLASDPIGEILAATSYRIWLLGKPTPGDLGWDLDDSGLKTRMANRDRRLKYEDLRKKNKQKLDQLANNKPDKDTPEGLGALGDPSLDESIRGGILAGIEKSEYGLGAALSVAAIYVDLWKVVLEEGYREGWLEGLRRGYIAGYSDVEGATASEELVGARGLGEIAAAWRLSWWPELPSIDKLLGEAEPNVRRQIHLVLLAGLSLSGASGSRHVFQKFSPQGTEHEAMVFIANYALISNNFDSALLALRKLQQVVGAHSAAKLPPPKVRNRYNELGTWRSSLRGYLPMLNETVPSTWPNLIVWSYAIAHGQPQAAWAAVSALKEEEAPDEEVLIVLLVALSAAKQQGRHQEALAWLEASQFADRWEPLTIAMRLSSEADQNSELGRLAPELRRPVEEMLVLLEQKPPQDEPEPRVGE